MRLAFFAAAFALSGACAAQDAATVVPANVVPQPGQVVASGAVPDQATKADVLAKLQQLYGVGNVIDRIDVGGVVAPPNWSTHVGKMISPPLKQINRGQLDIDGTQISLRGEVQNEASRQQIASSLATALNPTYKIVNGLRVAAAKDEQGMLDNLLANRTVEFETGSATLTTRGRELLDEVANVLPRIRADKVQIIGHTDSSGSRATNLALSQARADAVKAYMVEKGLPAARFDAVGVGPDQPLMTNATAEGRAKNRRIEFRAGS